MIIHDITDVEFKKYGSIIEGIDFSELVEKMQSTPGDQGIIYEPSVQALEELQVYDQLKTAIFGEIPIQIGYCNGNSYKLNAVEYHKTSEVNIGATDIILLLGAQQDISGDFTYDTSNIKAFLLPKGMGVELYATTLHYAPCNAHKTGFKAAIVLPEGTNLPLRETHGNEGEEKLITARNKWLIGHEEGGFRNGGHIGLIGENISVASVIV